MKTVTRYEANDGSEWTKEADARARDQLIAEVSDVMSVLPKPPRDALDGGKAYFQHSPANVLAAQAGLARAYLKRWKDCNGHIQWVIDADKPAGGTFFGRILSDGDMARPIWGGWSRIECIDSRFREWEQPYFTRNPPNGAVNAQGKSEGQS